MNSRKETYTMTHSLECSHSLKLRIHSQLYGAGFGCGCREGGRERGGKGRGEDDDDEEDELDIYLTTSSKEQLT